MNHVNLIGKTSSGRTIAADRSEVKFRMQTKVSFVNEKGELETSTQEHAIIATGRWVRVLEEIENFNKSEIAIEGSLKTIGWKVFIQINDLILL